MSLLRRTKKPTEDAVEEQSEEEETTKAPRLAKAKGVTKKKGGKKAQKTDGEKKKRKPKPPATHPYHSFIDSLCGEIRDKGIHMSKEAKDIMCDFSNNWVESTTEHSIKFLKLNKKATFNKEAAMAGISFLINKIPDDIKVVGKHLAQHIKDEANLSVTRFNQSKAVKEDEENKEEPKKKKVTEKKK